MTKSKPSVLLLITELVPAGAEKVVYSLATHLSSDFDMHVACLSGRRGAVGDWLEEAGIPVCYVDMQRKFQFWKLIRLFRYCKQHQIQILHTHLFHANVIGRIIGTLAGCPAILSTVHIVERRFRPWHFWLDRLTHFFMRYEICVSQAVLRFTEEKTKIPSKKLKCILNGIPLKAFQEQSEWKPSKEEIQELYALDSRPDLVLGSVGRLSYQKGYPYLLRAFSKLWSEFQSRGRQLTLVLVGEGEDRKLLESLAQELGIANAVHFLGRREDIPRVLRGMDLFVMPSIYEGFGLVVVEAMASKVPVLATQVDSLPELIEDGETGFLVEPENTEPLAERILSVLLDPQLRDRVVSQAFDRVEHFDEKRMVEEYRSLYYHVLTQISGTSSTGFRGIEPF